jgi:hypothetical protein
MAKAFFVVRATVADASRRAAFDAWYSREHLPDAVKSFGAEKAWRYWSLTDPALHHAMYQFADEAALDRATKGENINRLVADFNRDWPDVTRTREVLVLAEEFGK